MDNVRGLYIQHSSHSCHTQFKEMTLKPSWSLDGAIHCSNETTTTYYQYMQHFRDKKLFLGSKLCKLNTDTKNVILYDLHLPHALNLRL